MKVNNTRILSVLFISFSLLYNSCTFVGFGIGAVIDSGPNLHNKINNLDDYKIITQHQKIDVHFWDNSSMVGIFDGIDVISPTDGDIRDNVEKFLILKTRFGVEQINLDEIRFVDIRSRRNGKRYGLIIGLGIDLALYFAFIAWYGDGT